MQIARYRRGELTGHHGHGGDVATFGEIFCVSGGHTSSVVSLTFSATGAVVASGSSDNPVKIWRSHTGQLLQTLGGYDGWITSVAMSGKGDLLAAGSSEGTVRFWDI